jgi:hypothetical protein
LHTLEHEQKDRLAAVSPKSNLFFDLGRSLLLPAPAEQTQSGEAGGEEGESGWGELDLQARTPS